jgi:hypothetical protein
VFFCEIPEGEARIQTKDKGKVFFIKGFLLFVLSLFLGSPEEGEVMSVSPRQSLSAPTSQKRRKPTVYVRCSVFHHRCHSHPHVSCLHLPTNLSEGRKKKEEEKPEP